MAISEQVSDAIEAFEASQAEGVWPRIRKAHLIEDIRIRVGDPFHVRQASTPLCGPAAIVFELASRQPTRYVQICQELYETGGFSGSTERCEPSSKLRSSRVRSETAAADWMLLASMRDAENALFAVDEYSGQFVLGISTPWEMEGWIRELLGYSRTTFESTFVYGEFDAIEEAEQVRSRGGVAFPLIDAALVEGPTPSVAIPNHWVSLLGRLEVKEGSWPWGSGHVRFECYSWGIWPRVVDTDEGRFEDYMWGVVTGEEG